MGDGPEVACDHYELAASALYAHHRYFTATGRSWDATRTHADPTIRAIAGLCYGEAGAVLVALDRANCIPTAAPPIGRNGEPS